MKRMIRLLVLLAAAAGVILTGCAARDPGRPTPEAAEGGILTDSTDHSAPKTITSTQIVVFSCEFSGMTMDAADSHLAGSAYGLWAKLENGAVKGSIRVRNAQGEREEPFRASHELLNELQAVVAAYDLAQYNGRSIRVSGLPDDLGAELEIVYASGETIRAGDNQTCFIPIRALEELEALFLAQLPQTPAVRQGENN